MDWVVSFTEKKVTNSQLIYKQGNGPYLSDAEIAAENLPVLIPLPIPGRTGGGCL